MIFNLRHHLGLDSVNSTVRCTLSQSNMEMHLIFGQEILVTSTITQFGPMREHLHFELGTDRLVCIGKESVIALVVVLLVGAL